MVILLTLGFACSNKNGKESSTGGSSSNITEGAEFDVQVTQKRVRRVDSMPGLMNDYTELDFKAMAEVLDELLYSFSDTPEYVPMSEQTYAPIGYWDIAADGTRSFGIPSYVGHYSGSLQNGTVVPGTQEGVTTIASVLGSSLAGIDKSNQNGYDFVSMLDCFYNPNQGLVLNRKGALSGASFWYDLTPQIQYARIYDMYKGGEGMEGMKEIVLEGARKWLGALDSFKGKNGELSFDFLGFDMAAMQPTENGKWIEPPHAAIAYILYSGYSVTDSEVEKAEFIRGMKLCMDALDDYPRDYSYEVIQDLSPLMAAIMNWQFGTDYDVDVMLNNIFDGESDTRRDFGMISGEWGDYCVDGLIGQDDYAFLMNVYNLGGILAPLVKYEPSYADAVGKWFLNVSDHVKIFYPGYLSAENQYHGGAFQEDEAGVIAYESVRKSYGGKTPFAIGDPTEYGWGKTNYGLYGSVQVGVFASIIERTEVEQILRLNLNATDFFSESGTEEYLYYNPYPQDKQITFNREGKFSLIDKLSGKYVAQNAQNSAVITIPAMGSAVVAVIPHGVEVTQGDDGLYADGELFAIKQVGVSILNPSVKFEVVSGQVPLVLSATESEGMQMTIRRNNTVLYSGDYTESYLLDTTVLPDGRCRISCEIRTADGLTDRATVPVDIANRGDREQKVFCPTVGQMADRLSTDGTATVSGGKYVVERGEGKIVTVKSEEFELDLDRQPRLYLDLTTSGYYDINIYCDGLGTLRGGWAESKNGVVSVDIVEMAASYGGVREPLKGKHTVRVGIRSYGEEVNRIALRELSVVYPRAVSLTFNAEDIRQFTSYDMAIFKPCTVAVQDGGCVITEANKNGKQGNAVSGYFVVDIYRCPVVNIELGEIYGTFVLRIVIGSRAYVLLETEQSGCYSVNVVEILSTEYPSLEPEDSLAVRVDLCVKNAEGAYATVKGLEVVYE